MVAGGQPHAPPPGKTRYILYRRLGGPQSWSGLAENLVPTRIFFLIHPYLLFYYCYIPAHTLFNLLRIRRKGPQFLYCHTLTVLPPLIITHTEASWSCSATVAVSSVRCYLLFPCALCSVLFSTPLCLTSRRMYLSHPLVRFYAAGGVGEGVFDSFCFPPLFSPDSSSTALCVGTRYTEQPRPFIVKHTLLPVNTTIILITTVLVLIHN